MISKDTHHSRTLLHLQAYLLAALILLFIPFFLLPSYQWDLLYVTLATPIFIACANAFSFQELFNLYCYESPMFTWSNYQWPKLFTTIRTGLLLAPIFMMFKAALVMDDVMHVMVFVLVACIILFIATVRYPLYIYLEPPQTAFSALKKSVLFAMTEWQTLIETAVASFGALRYNPGWLISGGLLLLLLLTSITLDDWHRLHLFLNVVFLCHLFTNISAFCYLLFLEYEVCGPEAGEIPE